MAIAASSGLTLLLTTVAAQVGGAVALGQFAACLSAYTVGIAVARALVPDVAIVTARSGDPEAALRAREGAAVLIIAAVFPLMLVIVLLQAQTSLVNSIVLTALVVPPVFQDSLRFLLIARDRYRLAAAADLMVLTAAGLSLFLIHTLGLLSSVTTVVAVWSASTLGLVVLFLSISRAAPSISGGLRFLSTHARLGAGFLADGGAAMVGSQATLTLVSGLAGVSALGAWRGAQSVVGPFGSIFQALQPLAVRQASSEGLDKRAWRRLAATSATLAAAAVGVAIALSAATSVGLLLFSDAWWDVRDVILPVTLYLIGSWLTLVPIVALRSSRRVGLLTRLRFVSVAIQIAVASVALALISDFAAACYVLAAAQLLLASVWWIFTAKLKEES